MNKTIKYILCVLIATAIILILWFFVTYAIRLLMIIVLVLLVRTIANMIFEEFFE